MKRSLLSAAVTLLTLSSSACQKGLPPKQQAVLLPAAVHAPLAAVAVAKGPVDAGVLPAVPAEESLAFAHEHRGPVDHLARAQEMRDEGDDAGALLEARKALYDNSEDTEALDVVIHTGVRVKKASQVVAAYERLAELEPDEAAPLIQEARVRVTMNDFAGAVRVAGEALLRDEGNPECYQALGRAYLGAGNLKEAIRALKQAVSLNPEHGYALNNLGYAYLRANQNQEAVNVLSEAAELLPNVAYVANNLGVALERTGRRDDAKVAYDRATSLSPKYVKALLNAERIQRVASTEPRSEDTTSAGLDAADPENMTGDLGVGLEGTDVSIDEE